MEHSRTVLEMSLEYCDIFFQKMKKNRTRKRRKKRRKKRKKKRKKKRRKKMKKKRRGED